MNFKQAFRTVMNRIHRCNHRYTIPSAAMLCILSRKDAYMNESWKKLKEAGGIYL